MLCRDKSLTLLAKHGYNVVRLPRTGIDPLCVFGRDRNGIEPLGRLPTIWETDADEPRMDDGDVAAEIKSVSTASIKVSLGLRILEDILSGLGASVPRLDFAYRGSRSLQFALSNIRIKKVDPFDVGQFLKSGDLQLANPWVDRYFLDDDADAYVITEVLTSDSVSVVASSKKDTSAELDIKAIEGAVGADVKVQVGSAAESEITYTGSMHLTFGFKAFQIGYDFDEDGDSNWRVTGIDPTKGDVYLDPSQRDSDGDGHIGRVNL